MLGKCLKTMRQRLQESLGETSGAVEIDVEQLDRFERGAEVPSEDVLMLLISHFGVDDDDAVELWELAGYDGMVSFDSFDPSEHPGHPDQGPHRSGRRPEGAAEDPGRHGLPVMLLALDNRVLYSNGVDLMADDAGIVLNFMQNNVDVTSQHTPNGQRFAVSRIGMSFDQAEQLAAIIQRAILHKRYRSGPKQLPPPSE